MYLTAVNENICNFCWGFVQFTNNYIILQILFTIMGKGFWKICVTGYLSAASDSTKNPQSKMSPSFKNLVNAFAWKDSYRYLHPKAKQYSRYYINDHQGEGASRIDRSYHWGSLEVQQAEYLSISFSDHPTKSHKPSPHH